MYRDGILELLGGGLMQVLYVSDQTSCLSAH